MKIEEILRLKGHEVVTVPPSLSVLEAVQLLVKHNIGGLPVMEEDRMAGIFTERDILRLTARSPNELGTIRVGDVMTREPFTAALDDDFHHVMDVMTEQRIRHLPVMDRERLAGIVSIGDLVKACLAQAEEENLQLREYIQGVG